MKRAAVADSEEKFSSYLKAAEKEPVLVTRNGQPVGLLVALTDDEERQRLLLAHSPKFQAMLDKARKRMKNGAGIPADAFWEELAKERQAEKVKKAPQNAHPPKANKPTRRR
jgi:antitoxin (DNA-binding transcriptional repressor) of toxin-antitoxin stability system